MATIVALGVAELAATLAIPIIHPLLDGGIRRRRTILAEQTERIAALLTGDTNRVLALDSSLGWRYRAGRADSIYGSNVWGARGRREYTPGPGHRVIRVAAFGDSFTYGNEVGNRDSWPAQIEHLHPDVEVLNYGVGGYGMDQAYLRFLGEGRVHGAQVAVLGFAPDDLGRLVNVYRRFRSSDELPLFKPRFRETPGGSLELLPNPAVSVSFYERLRRDPAAVAEVGVHDDWFEPVVYLSPWYDRSSVVRLVAGLGTHVHRRYLDDARLLRGDVFNVESPAFRIQVRLFQLFADSARARGLRPLVVFLPDRWTVEQANAQRLTVYSTLRDSVRSRGIAVLDAVEPFQLETGQDVSAWFMPGGHYSAKGNGIIARWLGTRLRFVASSPQGAPTP